MRCTARWLRGSDADLKALAAEADVVQLRAYQDALRTCDNHVIYKNGAKEIAHQHGCSITFMAVA